MTRIFAVLALLALPLVACGETKVHKSQVSATGTPSATTYLRGDGTWSAPEDVSVAGSYTIPPGGTTIQANYCQSMAVTVTGATAGAVCAVGLPANHPHMDTAEATSTGGQSVACVVNATNTALIRLCNYTATPWALAEGAVYRVRVWN